MRKSLVAVLLALGATSLSYGDDSAPFDGGHPGGPYDHHVLYAFDSHGKRIGPVLSLGTIDGVILSINGVTTFIPVERVTNSAGQFLASQYEWWSGTYSSIFPSSDCSGPPIIVGDVLGTLRPSTVIRQGNDATAYIAPDTYSTTITTAMSLYSSGQCLSGSTLPPYITGEGWTPESSYSLTQNYPEPLSIHY
ncbi:MAG: hypothetical protein WCA85_10225 [Paraburkholderia sp.]|uniref:hypothetical protein n=1 Tax=Paraburkholderia sp. TaxID=1926495 RepID=UPI003C66CB6F